MNRYVLAHRLISAALLAAALALGACGGSGDSGGPPVDTIGAAGGAVDGPAGTRVVVPAGALNADAVISITPTAARSMPAGWQALGATYELGPAGTRFAAPVTVTLPFNPAQVPAGARIRMLHEQHGAGGSAWEELPGLVVGAASVSAQTTSFSHFVVAIGNSPPSITAQPVDGNAVAPAGLGFSVTFVGTPSFDVQWQRSNDGGATWSAAGAVQTVTTLPGTSSLLLGTTNAAAAAAGGDHGALFRAAISNIETPVAAPVLSNVVTLSVTAAVIPPTITTQPQSASGSIGNVSFSVQASGSNLVYQWHKDGQPLAGQTAPTLTLVNVQAADAGNYTVVVSNLVGGLPVNSVTSSVATLTVTAPPAPSAAARVAAGGDFSLARLANGQIYTWGSDAGGTLGAGAGDQTRSTPGPLAPVSGFQGQFNNTAIAAGGSHALAAFVGGGVQAWGYNGFGQLANGNNLSQETPTLSTETSTLLGYRNAIEVCGGSLHSMVLRADGSVHAMGNNSFGQLGDGSITERRRSVAVSGIGTAIAIACRGNHSLALLADGTVRQWGLIYQGRPGGAATVEVHSPVVVAGLSNVIAIAAGNEHALALRSDGSVWAWGSNVNGKLGDGTETDRLVPTPTLLGAQITAIAAGHMNSLALRSDGTVLSWGINETGQLGSGLLVPGYRPSPAPVPGLGGVVAIALGTGIGHGLAVRSDGSVWAWGHNSSGQLGIASSTPFSATPIQVPGLNLN